MNTLADNQELNSLRSELVSELNGEKPTTTETKPTGEAEKKVVPGEGSTTEPKTTEKEDDKTPDTNKPKEGAATQTDEEKLAAEKAAREKSSETESDYIKAKKDRERFRTNWAEMEKEKTALKAQQDEFRKQQDELRQERARLEQERLKSANDTRKTSKYTPEQLERYAREFEAEGKPELAAAARAKAQDLREAVNVEQQEATKQKHEQYRQAAEQHWKKATTDFPDAAKDDSPLRQRANQVYKDVAAELTKMGMRPSPSLQYLAVQHADALLKAEGAKSEIETLKAKVTELETENKRLTKSTALPGAKPAGNVPANKDVASLPLDQQRKSLREGLTQS